jgi:hypothetical protein
MQDASYSAALPPLPEAPTVERIHELGDLLSLVHGEFVELVDDLTLFAESGYGWQEGLRQLELEKKLGFDWQDTIDRLRGPVESGTIQAADVDELERLEAETAELRRLVALRDRASAAPDTLEPELIARLAVLVEWVEHDTGILRENAAVLRDKLPELSGFEQLPPGGAREQAERMAAMFERRAAEARHKAEEKGGDDA